MADDSCVRMINCICAHPQMPGYEIILMDDGFTSVVRAKSVPLGTKYVRVSGDDLMLSGVRSYGNVVTPITDANTDGLLVDRPRTSHKVTLSDCFHGLHSTLFMWGTKGTEANVPIGGADIDRTEIVFNCGDRLACFTADWNGTPHFFDSYGSEIDHRMANAWKQIYTLKNYYCFCGVMSADRTHFTAHCIWNTNGNPVGPPCDRRIAEFVGIDFAPSVPAVSAEPGKTFMVRVDTHIPIVIVS